MFVKEVKCVIFGIAYELFDMEGVGVVLRSPFVYNDIWFALLLVGEVR